jgi:hypothetical protein
MEVQIINGDKINDAIESEYDQEKTFTSYSTESSSSSSNTINNINSNIPGYY